MQLIKCSSSKFSKSQALQIKKLLALCNWNSRQINGQITALKKFLKGSGCCVFLAIENKKIVGYISAEFYNWNCLGQIHGLAIHPDFRRRGYASHLVEKVETFLKRKHARGVYVDTPVNNKQGCNFYKSLGYKKAYIMPKYYDADLDGITFLKFFRK